MGAALAVKHGGDQKPVGGDARPLQLELLEKSEVFAIPAALGGKRPMFGGLVLALVRDLANTQVNGSVDPVCEFELRRRAVL